MKSTVVTESGLAAFSPGYRGCPGLGTGCPVTRIKIRVPRAVHDFRRPGSDGGRS